MDLCHERKQKSREAKIHRRMYSILKDFQEEKWGNDPPEDS